MVSGERCREMGVALETVPYTVFPADTVFPVFPLHRYAPRTREVVIESGARRVQPMKPLPVFVAFVAFVVPNAPLAADKTDLDGYWWEKLDASFKLGWVSGYAKAMDLAGTIQMSTCASNMPLYVKVFPNTDPKVILQKMCLSDNQFDYDGISMGQFVDGMNVFYEDYRNKQLEVGWAIQYARDAIKGKPRQELDAEVTVWRRCSATDLLASLKARLAKLDQAIVDKDAKDYLLRLARNWLVEREVAPGTEGVMFPLIEQQLRNAEDLVAKYGSNLRVVG